MTVLYDKPTAKGETVPKPILQACTPSLLCKIVKYRPRLVVFNGKKVYEMVNAYLHSLNPRLSEDSDVGLKPIIISLPPRCPGGEREKVFFWCLPSTVASIKDVEQHRMWTAMRRGLEALRRNSLPLPRNSVEFRAEDLPLPDDNDESEEEEDDELDQEEDDDLDQEEDDELDQEKDELEQEDQEEPGLAVEAAMNFDPVPAAEPLPSTSAAASSEEDLNPEESDGEDMFEDAIDVLEEAVIEENKSQVRDAVEVSQTEPGVEMDSITADLEQPEEGIQVEAEEGSIGTSAAKSRCCVM
ncbi:uncharacterized protein JCM6883_002748 [Sporobolomyces salmoneus]|uniref:uncharacterized protein n=1 Tax=Sporobolomyces salmoneus TaxID=183962 RepID=UPI003173BB2F